MYKLLVVIAIWDPCEELGGAELQAVTCGNKQHVGTPLLFCEMRCILGVAGWEMDWKTPVTEQLFVLREWRGLWLSCWWLTACWLLVLFHTMCVCVCVCVSLMYETGVVGSRFPFPQCVPFESEIWMHRILVMFGRVGAWHPFPSDDTMFYHHKLVKRQES